MYRPALNKTNSTYGLECFTSLKEMKRNTNLHVSMMEREADSLTLLVMARGS